MFGRGQILTLAMPHQLKGSQCPSPARNSHTIASNVSDSLPAIPPPQQFSPARCIADEPDLTCVGPAASSPTTSRADGEPITFAGLWDEWKDRPTLIEPLM
jgi:hypothetical protein